jgi:hypothetical protein
LDDELAEQRWRTPLITTAWAHLEMFAATRLAHGERLALMRAVPGVYRRRWLGLMLREAEALQTQLPALLDRMERSDRTAAQWQARNIGGCVLAAQTMVPEVDFGPVLLELAAFAGEPVSK